MADSSTISKSTNKKIKIKMVKEPSFWTEDEDKILMEKAEEYNYKNWNAIANFIPGRTSIQCSARYRRIRPGLIKGAWSKEEDNKLLYLFEKYGRNWAAISKEMPHRTGKQIRDRFLNSLDSKFERGKFTEEEDQLIIKYYKIYGNSWAIIAKKLKTRTGDMVKNRFYSSLKKIIFKNKNMRKKAQCLSSCKTKNKVKKEKSNSTQKFKASIKNDDENEITEKKDEKEEEKEISDTFDDIKNINDENEDFIDKKNLDDLNETYDNNNNKLEVNNKIIIKNDSMEEEPESEKNSNINNYENEANQRLNNYNYIPLNPYDNNKNNEILNERGYNDNYNYQYNSGMFCDFNNYLNNNNNNNLLFYPNEIDTRLDKYKNSAKLEIDYKQDVKEQLNVIFDLENILNQKLFNIQRELENN